MPRIPQNIYPQIHPTIPAWARVTGVSGSFRADQSQFTITWDITNVAKLGQTVQEFVRDVLGYSTRFGVQPSGPSNKLKINRRLPARCPYAPWLVASQIPSLVPHGPHEQRVYGSTVIQEYKLWTATVVYESAAFDIKANTAVEHEWERFVIWKGATSVQAVQQEEGKFQWPLEATQYPLGERVTKSGGLSSRIVKRRLELTWLNVPDDGLFTRGGLNFGGLAPSLDDGLGKVNDRPWPDEDAYPAGTLLFEGWSLTPHTMPRIVGLPSASDGTELVQQRSWDVAMTFSFFDPPSGHPKQLIQVEGQPSKFPARGHNLIPSPKDNLWYRIHIVDRRFLHKYDVYDYNKLFEMNA